MPFYNVPGVYVLEVPGPKTIQPVPTSVAAFVGQAPDPKAHLGEAYPVNNWSQFLAEFVPDETPTSKPASTILSHAVYGFFQNQGSRCFIVNMPDTDAIAGTDRPRTGLKLLEETDEISIVAAPGRTDVQSHNALTDHCEAMKDRVCILDTPNLQNTELLKIAETAGGDDDKNKKPGALPRTSSYSATYFPWFYVADALNPKADKPVAVPPSGHMAGVWARTDAERGVHKAPANTPIAGVLNLTYRVTGAEQGDLNSKGVNCIRYFSTEGIRVWGARTRAGEESEWRYINVRRLCIMIEESIKRNTSWVVFEPNDLTLWKSVRNEISGFLSNVYRDGALVGATPEEAFFVKCDAETNPPESVDMGQLITVVGISPVKPAEFIIFKIAQNAGGAQTEAL